MIDPPIEPPGIDEEWLLLWHQAHAEMAIFDAFHRRTSSSESATSLVERGFDITSVVWPRQR